MQELFKFLKGYVIIKVTGVFPERFLNLAARNNLYVWDVRRVDKNVYILKISARAFLELKKIAYNSDCHVSIISKKGLFFTLRNIKNIRIVLIGAALFAAIIVYASGSITDIYITGNENIASYEIEKRLEAYGLKPGVRKASVDTKDIKLRFLKEFEDVSYIAVNLHGTKAYVQIAEAAKKPFITDADAPCNIVSDVDGIIETLRVKTGFPVVSEGDAVCQGQLLVSGITDSRFLTVRYVNCDADIVIRTWRDFCREFPLKKEIRTKTDETEYSLEIIVNGKTIKKAKTKYKEYSHKINHIFKSSFVEINKYEFIKENVSYEVMSVKDAFDYYYSSFLEESKKTLKEGTQIAFVKHNYKEDSGKIRIWIELETLENRGVKQEIKKEEEYGENN